MTFASAYVLFLLVALVATLFLVLTNTRRAKLPIKHISGYVLGVELLVLVLWSISFAALYNAPHGWPTYLYACFLCIASIGGWFLIKASTGHDAERAALRTKAASLGESNGRLAEIDTQKTAFISIASHQLRGPLTAIHGQVSMLLEGEYGDVPEHLRQPLERVQTSSQTLRTLINDFLNVALLEQGRLQYVIAPFDIVEVLNQAITLSRPHFKKAGIALTPVFTTDHPMMVLGDAAKTKTVFMQLLDNALKYTPAGSVTVSIACKNDDVIVTILDTGIGIPDEDKKRLFQKFTRSDDAIHQSVYGSGLGLFVAKEMIEAQHGHIWFESAGRNKGSRFFVALPLAR
ncbi:MAG: hypothetical protein RL150_365 [Candidatus Parcubacteria bacterium]|jgi:signal transduction histidine kinase